MKYESCPRGGEGTPPDGEAADDELMNILLAPRWLPQVEGGDVVSSKFPLHGDCKVYRTRRTPRLNK